MAKMYRKWSKADDAELLSLVAGGDERAFTEFVDRYAMPVALLASRVLGAPPPIDLSVAIFSRIRFLAHEAPEDAASMQGWALNLALVVSRDYATGNHRDRTTVSEDEAQNLAKQLAGNADLFRHIEEYIVRHPMPPDPAQGGRVGAARGRYIVTPAFDDPLPEFEAYE